MARCDGNREPLPLGHDAGQACKPRAPGFPFATRYEEVMQTLAIDRELFMMAFGRDIDYHDSLPQGTWLDRSTGEVLWFYECDADAFFEVGMPARENREERERVEAEPERYLEIPGLGHGEHHGILREFLRSDWTGDEARLLRADAAYSGSIGRWMRDVGDEGAVRAFREYREARIAAMAEEFLRENGVVPGWKSRA